MSTEKSISLLKKRIIGIIRANLSFDTVIQIRYDEKYTDYQTNRVYMEDKSTGGNKYCGCIKIKQNGKVLHHVSSRETEQDVVLHLKNSSKPSLN